MVKLGLFFSSGVSLTDWYNKGMFYREKLIYEKYLENNFFEKIYWFTYGGSKDLKLAKYLQKKDELDKRIIVISKPDLFKGRFGSLLYSIVLPFLESKLMKECAILKTNQILGSWTAIVAKWVHNKPVIVRSGYTPTFMGKDFNIWNKFIFSCFEKFAYKFASYSIVASEEDRKYLIKRYKINGERIMFNYNYVHTDLFIPLKAKRFKNRIIFVGRFTHQKNLKNLIKALKGLDIGLDLYGCGEQQKMLNDMAKNIGVDIRFLGKVANSDLPLILNRYHYYILPSYYEGMPKTLIEAMSCGLICLASNVQGNNEVIKHLKNGYLFSTDFKSIRDCIKEVVNNRKKFEYLKENARASIEENFSLNSIFVNECNLVMKLLNK